LRVEELGEKLRHSTLDSYSVIIPAFNAESTIAEAVASARSQEPAPLEIIVACDGCTDGTASCATAAGARVIELPKANGSVARNAAAADAAGDLLFFLDADDWWLPGKVATHLDAWHAAVPRPSFVVDVAQKVRPEGSYAGLLGAGVEGPVAWAEYLKWTTWTSGSSFSVPRSTYAALDGFNEMLVSQQDVDFWVRAAHAFGPAYRISKPHTCYRLSPGGVSKSPKDVEANLTRLLKGWPFATERQKREFFVQMALTAAGFTPFPASLKYIAIAGWPLLRGKTYRALARSILRR
jgi:glycosyltransferase involved in cell wall biosynthesis